MPRSLLPVLVLLLVVAPLRGQEDESEMSRVRRDQSRIVQRLLSLQEKMDRLSERYASEGRERNAELLRQALERMEADGLLAAGRAVEQSLEAGLLATVERQDELTSALEGIYALLRDRGDTEALEEQVNLVNEALAEIGFLAEDQRDLQARTRGASETPAELLDEALDVASEVQEALGSSQAATAELSAAQQGLGESRQAAALAEAQRALAERSAEPGALDVQRELSSALAGLRESLAEAGLAAGDGELAAELAGARTRARELAAAAAEAMRAAEERLASRDASGATSRDGGAAGAGVAGSQQAGAQQTSAGEGEAGASGGEQASGGQQSGAQQAGGEQGGGEQASGGQQSGAQQAGGEQGEGEQASGGQQSGAQQAGGEQGGGEQAGGEPSQGASDGESPGTPREAMEQAAASLEQLAALLGESERALAVQRNRARAQGLTSARQAGARATELEELMERLEAAEPEAGPELLDRTRELMGGLDQAREALDAGRAEQAAATQSQAANDLAALMEALRARRQGASETPPDPLDEAGRQALAAEQRDVQRRLRELMDRLSELPDQEFRAPAERASSAMDRAQEDIDQGRLDEAALRQQEAAEELEQTREELAQERDRYDELRQEEVLFRLGEELRGMLEAQRAVSAETADIDALRGDGERLGRSQRRALARLANEQRDLALSAGGAADALQDDGAVVFVFALRRIGDDMASVADRLEDESTDGFVRALQAGVERRLLDLLDVLEQELQRRREQTEPPGEGEEQQPQQQGPPPLVPPVAELLLVQRLELMALDRVERFGELFPEAMESGELSPMQAREIERWAVEHLRITELFEELIPEAPEAPPPIPTQGHPPKGAGPDPDEEDAR